MMDLNEYWKELTQEANLPEEQASIVSGLLDNEGFARVLKDRFIPRPEVDKALSAKDTAIAEAQGKVNKAVEAVQKYDKWANETAIPEYEKEKKRAELLDKQNKAYAALYGELGSDDPPPTPPQTEPNGDQFITPEQYQEGINKVFDLTLEAYDIGLQHLHRFGEPLDLKGFRAHAEEGFKKAAQSNTPYSMGQAYREFASEKIQQAEQSAFDKKVEEAAQTRFEKLKTEYTQQQTPLDTVPSSSDIYVRPDVRPGAKSDPLSEKEKIASFTEAWNDPSSELGAGN